MAKPARNDDRIRRGTVGALALSYGNVSADVGETVHRVSFNLSMN
jgi:hypothetical protein